MEVSMDVGTMWQVILNFMVTDTGKRAFDIDIKLTNDGYLPR